MKATTFLFLTNQNIRYKVFLWEKKWEYKGCVLLFLFNYPAEIVKRSRIKRIFIGDTCELTVTISSSSIKARTKSILMSKSQQLTHCHNGWSRLKTFWTSFKVITINSYLKGLYINMIKCLFNRDAADFDLIRADDLIFAG